MRNGQNKRMRGRNRKNQNPLTRVYESNGPDVKIRGTASHIAEKYLQLARDAQASGDPVGAENYLQHAEHYFRLIAAAQEQLRQSNPYYRGEADAREEGLEEIDEEGEVVPGLGEQPFGTAEPQPYLPRDAQPFPAREPAPAVPRPAGGRVQPPPPAEHPSIDRLPAFITGGDAPAAQGFAPNGHDGQPDRFPLHRRRRRHRGPRGDRPGAPPAMAGEGSEEPSAPAPREE
jgi:hypothetical protein